MLRARPIEDPARRWSGFCRAGLRMVGVASAIWFGSLALLFRVAPMPVPPSRADPPRVSWWPGAQGSDFEDRLTEDVRTLWSPSVFALPSPLGFSHLLRRERARLAPPMQVQRPSPAFGELAFSPPFSRGDVPVRLRWESEEQTVAFPPAAGVFPPKALEPDVPRLVFPEGWESRLFSGIDLDFAAWTNRPWSARIEMRFDGRGVPVSMLLAQATGLPEMDQRLARAANGWRLLDSNAPRAGTVAWDSPGTPIPVEGEAP